MAVALPRCPGESPAALRCAGAVWAGDRVSQYQPTSAVLEPATDSRPPSPLPADSEPPNFDQHPAYLYRPSSALSSTPSSALPFYSPFVDSPPLFRGLGEIIQQEHDPAEQKPDQSLLAPGPSVEPPADKGKEAPGSSSKSPQAGSSSKDDREPPPPYTESSSPLQSFTFCMAASVITQVSQTGPPVASLADVPDENLTLDLRGTQFVISRDELLTLPEFVLLSLFPNGLFPDGQFREDDIYSVDFDPACLQYMLEFFKRVGSTIPQSHEDDDTDHEVSPPNSPSNLLQDRAGIIVLREDLDFYVIPPKAEISQSHMLEVKRECANVLLSYDGIFSGLRRTDETGTTEQHLIEMLTAGGFNAEDRWGHRAREPNKAVICSLALARLRTDMRAGEGNQNTVGMAQKLLLFWRKPARRCWWEGMEVPGVPGVDGKLKVWIRRVWTLEMSVIGLR
ncbi:hypothetical protein DRE_01355 [Drechslerella stenobrocha 248]|uniref:WHI2-like protein P4H10.16c n=1 Tax=Drechslerella stenobrocha 248 TaxID=1043628 RepID=W7HVV2_9PEZI|nr:hypothetical protein DRE_01355 [Drechslerella stenobrocha 248]